MCKQISLFYIPNPFHKFPNGKSAVTSITILDTGCINFTLRECRQILPSGFERGNPYFKSPLIGLSVEIRTSNHP